MASLRRMASIDCILNSSSSSAKLSKTHLIRHSSLPNLFLCQPELTMGAISRRSSYNNGSLLNECPSFLTASKVALCRALSSSHSCDHGGFPELEIPACADVHGGFFNRPSYNGLNECTSYIINKKEAILAQSLDMEKSVVYSDLRESVCRWEVPPKFFKPYDMGEKAFTERGTPIHTLHKPCKPAEDKCQTLSDLCMEKSSQNDVKGRPMSLRMLKRKLSKVSPPASSGKKCKPKERVEKSCASELASYCDTAKPRLNVMGVRDSVSSAFASLVYMLKMLHQHALSPRMRTHASGVDASDDEKFRNWASRAYTEMLDSFLWLFQQVFSCTPKLMLLTMMLLADFTLHSVAKHVAVPLMPLGEPPTVATAPYNNGKPTIMGGIGPFSRSSDEEQRLVFVKKDVTEEECFGGILPDEHGGGGGSGGIVGAIKHGGSNYSDGDGDSSPLRKMTLERVSTVEGDDVVAGIPLSSSLLLESSLLSQHVGEIDKGTDLDLTTKNMLVAPVRAPVLEADDYPCFDRTDLAYQQEISMDPGNPLLLANYAQFLHVVRHDNSRAEKLYRRAVMVDMDVDGEVMARFASFLWVVKGDVEEADSVYKAAVEADPSNTYHAGCYAHFLWNSSACQAEETSSCCVVNNLGTIS